jgi:hypothetical protein
MYETKAYPTADSCFDLIETKLLAPHLGPVPHSEIAPQVQLTSGETGTGSDLETRIDQLAVERPVAPQNTSPLKDLFDISQILASLQVQSTERFRCRQRPPLRIRFLRYHALSVSPRATGARQRRRSRVRHSRTGDGLPVSALRRDVHPQLQRPHPHTRRTRSLSGRLSLITPSIASIAASTHRVGRAESRAGRRHPARFR